MSAIATAAGTEVARIESVDLAVGSVEYDDRDRNVHITVGAFKFHLQFRDYSDRANKTRFYVDDAITHAIDPELVVLSEAEAALGDKRWSERGVDADVDKLYDRLNRRIMKDKTNVARQALALFGDRGKAMIAATKFSRRAGCSMCPCSPGVVAGGMVKFPSRSGYDRQISRIWISFTDEAKAEIESRKAVQS